MKLSDVPEPQLPGRDWVKIKTSACGFCASDLNLIFLKESPTASPFASSPCVMGHEFCGHVVENGKDATDIPNGAFVAVAPHLNCPCRGIKPVCAACESGRFSSCENFAAGKLAPGMFQGFCADLPGGFAPYVLAHKSQVFVLPEGFDEKTAIMMEPLCVSLASALENKPDKKDKVLVIGAGVIGTLVVASLRALDIDCEITVADPSAFAAGLAKEAGADHVITDGDLFSHTVAITGAKRHKPIIGRDILMGGFDRIFDCVGNSRTLNDSLRCLAAGGTLMVAGISETVKLDLTPLWLKSQTVKGTLGYGLRTYKRKKRHVFEIALDLLQEGKIRTDHMVTHFFPIDAYKTMIETNLNKTKHKAIKTAVRFS